MTIIHKCGKIPVSYTHLDVYKRQSLSNSATDDVSGTTAIGKFIEGMNDYAVSIGMCGSHFESPDGYYSDGHYSTLEDIAIVSKLAYENEIRCV